MYDVWTREGNVLVNFRSCLKENWGINKGRRKCLEEGKGI